MQIFVCEMGKIRFNKRGQPLGITWFVWLVLLILAGFLIGSIAFLAFGKIRGPIQQIPEDLALRSEACKQYVDSSLVAYCGLTKVAKYEYTNCEDERIQLDLRANDIKTEFKCGSGKESENAKKVCELEKKKNSDWEKILVGGKNKRACGDWL
jgi:hypothetical protein